MPIFVDLFLFGDQGSVEKEGKAQQQTHPTGQRNPYRFF